MKDNISPSSSKDGIVRIIQPWLNYINSKGDVGRRHYGIDIMCGWYEEDVMVAFEDCIVVEIIEGSKKVSGTMVLESIKSGFILKYKHMGDFLFKVADIVLANQVLGVPNLTNTNQKHIHLETWDADNNYNPLLYLDKMQGDLKYEFSTRTPVENYYKNNDPELYKRIKDRIIPKGEQVW